MPPVNLRRFSPYVLLAMMLSAVFIGLVVRGLNLGFFSDILGVEYQFNVLGLKDGMRWVLDYDARHLLSGHFYALIHVLFQGQSAAWYASSILLHFAAAFVMFGFLDTLFHSKQRAMSLGAALIFAFYVRQVPIHYENATGGFMKVQVLLALLALWVYLRYLRENRRQVFWRDLSLGAYVTGFLLYETVAFWFVALPVLAFVEQPPRGKWRPWLWQVAQDGAPYPILFGMYWYLLTLFQPPIRWSTDSAFGFGAIPAQMMRLLGAEFGPDLIGVRLNAAFNGGWVVITLGALLVMAVAAYWQFRPISSNVIPFERVRSATVLLILGGTLAVVSALVAAVSGESLAGNARLVYPWAAGISMMLAGAAWWLATFIPVPSFRPVLYSVLIGLIAAPGVSALFQERDRYDSSNQRREAVYRAVQDVVSLPDDGTLPYILLISDAHPVRELGLDAQDTRFPYSFDLLYGTVGILADAVIPDVPPEQAPGDTTGADYHGQVIIIEEDAIYSPIRADEAIPLNRLVIVHYDSATQTAEILPELPMNTLGSGIVVRTVEPPRTAAVFLVP